MLTDKEKKARKELRCEIKARKLVIKKIENAYNRLSQQAENQRTKREQKVANMFELYRNVDDARDAYGWGFISEEEFRQIEEAFEKGEKELLNNKSNEEYAAKILGEFITRLKHDISGFEFELLPEKEQNRIRERNYEIAMRRKERNNERW